MSSFVELHVDSSIVTTYCCTVIASVCIMLMTGILLVSKDYRVVVEFTEVGRETPEVVCMRHKSVEYGTSVAQI